MLFSIILNEKLYHFKEEISILEACNAAGIKLPRFCYHENLSIAGNCRMCLVEIEKSLKPIVACATEIINGMIIYTNSPLTLKARENVLEMLLLNHPLDCPICDQGGECDLQDQAIFFGSNFSRNYFSKRSVEDKNCGNLIKTIMNRCIHCTRCVRFGEEICGLKFFGTLNRGLKTEIGNYILNLSISKVSANVVDLCPVGALTLKPTSFKCRPWELFSISSIDLTDSFGTNVYLLYKGNTVLKVVPKYNALLNDSWISDKARFYYNVSYSKQIYCFSNYLDPLTYNKKSLFLFNSNLDLETLYFLKKKAFFSNFKNSLRLLNSTPNQTNFFFWGTKHRIKSLSSLSDSLCIFLSSNLDIESTLFNVKLRYKVIYSNIQTYSASPFFKSTFPIKFLKFSIIEIINLLLGKNLKLSQFFFKHNILFFSNKAILDRLDFYLLKIFSSKIPQNLFFNISAYCNTEGANILNFKKVNMKEFIFHNNIFALNLNDTFLLRKLIFLNTNIFWVNQYSSNILSVLSKNSWINISLNQDSGFYLNLEQRPQLMNLLKEKSIFTIYMFLNNFKMDIEIDTNLYLFNKINQKYIRKYYILNYFLEVVFRPFIFESFSFKFLFFKSLFSYSSFFFFKNFPQKLIIEDPYRTSLSLKYSPSLIKSSQNLRQNSFF